MTKPEKLYQQLLASTSRSISFRDFERLLVAFGFVHERTRGSHKQYAYPRIPFVLTINPDGHDARRYQVRLLLEFVRGIRPTSGRVTEPHYHINLFWSDEDSVWIADVPDLRGCRTHGDTRVKALANAADAIDGWLEVAREKGFPIPEPRYRPAIYAAA